ncbi:MAG: hypothetical protein AAF564_22230 [Bacteroidota bacterium]
MQNAALDLIELFIKTKTEMVHISEYSRLGSQKKIADQLDMHQTSVDKMKHRNIFLLKGPDGMHAVEVKAVGNRLDEAHRNKKAPISGN